jgi:hypothetical protein
LCFISEALFLLAFFLSDFGHTEISSLFQLVVQGDIIPAPAGKIKLIFFFAVGLAGTAAIAPAAVAGRAVSSSRPRRRHFPYPLSRPG